MKQATAYAAQAARRAALMAQMEPGALAVIGTAPEVLRNGDSDFPYRHDSGFYYLTGFGEPDSVLVLVAAGAGHAARSILFCRARNSAREIWDGRRHGPDGALATFGFDAAYPIEELDAEMARLLAAGAPALYSCSEPVGPLNGQIRFWLHNAGSGAVDRAPPAQRDLATLLDEMRVIKDPGEQALMRRAAEISATAVRRAMAATRPGMAEYEIEAELLYEFRRNGAQFPAYTPIVAAGANACILHYNTNHGQARDGELVLIDAGCEFDGYAADISRTYPVNGRFTAPQRALYQLVLAAQQAALDAVLPGFPYAGIHAAALAVLAEGMLELGLLDRQRHGGAQDVIADKSYLQFYMHGSGHWLGMDVHDVGAYRDPALAGQPSRALQAGMVLTVEPGIYVRPAPGVPEQYWNIGIRIEDDVLVTADGQQILSGAAPKTVAAIEQSMKHQATGSA